MKTVCIIVILVMLVILVADFLIEAYLDMKETIDEETKEA